VQEEKKRRTETGEMRVKKCVKLYCKTIARQVAQNVARAGMGWYEKGGNICLKLSDKLWMAEQV